MPKQPDRKAKMTRKQKIAATNSDQTAASVTSSNGEVEYLENPVKSRIDKNEYRCLKLPNGLKVVLVSLRGINNPSFDLCCIAKYRNTDLMKLLVWNGTCLASCRLCIDVGKFSDSTEIPCIASLLANVVLKASKKYPAVNTLSNFVSKCDGKTLTFAEHPEKTSFLVYVSENYFRETLDIFANCFIEPLLVPGEIENERNRVGMFEDPLSGFMVNKTIKGNDTLLEHLASKSDEHPGKHLKPGYERALKSHSRRKVFEEVKKFMKRHYSAHRMTVVLDARMSLDKLEHYAKKYFSKIPNNGMPAIDLTRFSFDKCFDTPDFKMSYQIQSFDDSNDYKLELNWPMPSFNVLCKSKPHRYIWWILKDERAGSLIWYYREKNWCTEIKCSIGKSTFEDNSVYSLFNLVLTLTDEGHKNFKKVVGTVYSYINLLRREGPQKKIHDELRDTAYNTFSNYYTAFWAQCYLQLCINMQRYSSADYLTGGYLFLEYDPTLIKRCLDMLSPEKANIIVHDKNFHDIDSAPKGWDKAVYNVEQLKYRRTAIPKDWIDYWKKVKPLSVFSIPGVKVPDNLSSNPVVENAFQYPEKIHSDKSCEVYYKLDKTFGGSLNLVCLCYCTPLPMESAENSIMMKLFGELLAQLLRANLEATRCDFGANILGYEEGLVVEIDGGNKCILRPMGIVAKHIAMLPNVVTNTSFATHKAILLKKYLNNLRTPEVLAREVTLGLVMPIHWTALEKHTATSGANFEKFKSFAKHFVEHTYIRCLAQGNMMGSDVIKGVQKCIETMKCDVQLTNTITRTIIYEIPRETHYCRFQAIEPIRDISVVRNYYQIDDSSFRQSVLMSLFLSLMSSPSFATLRVQEHCDDYSIYPTVDVNFNGYSLSAQKPQKKTITGVAKIDETIERYRKGWNKLFNKMQVKDWVMVIKIFKTNDCSPDAHLYEEFLRNCVELRSGTCVFDRRDQVLKALEEFKIEDLKKAMMDITSNGVRKLSVQVVSSREFNQGSAKTDQAQNSANSSGQYRMQFLTKLPNEKLMKEDHYITDIEAYKRGLQTYLALGASATDDTAEATQKA